MSKNENKNELKNNEKDIEKNNNEININIENMQNVNEDIKDIKKEEEKENNNNNNKYKTLKTNKVIAYNHIKNDTSPPADNKNTQNIINKIIKYFNDDFFNDLQSFKNELKSLESDKIILISLKRNSLVK